MRRFVLCLVVALSLLLHLSQRAEAVDRSKFRTCADTGFCRRHRGAAAVHTYRVEGGSLRVSRDVIEGRISGSTGAHSGELKLQITICESDAIRIKISEEKPRWQPLDLLMPDGVKPSATKSFTLLDNGDARAPEEIRKGDGAGKPMSFVLESSEGSDGSTIVLVVYTDPLKFEMYYDGVLQFAANDRSLMHFEKQSHAGATTEAAAAVVAGDNDRHGGKEVVDYGEDGLAIYADGSREEKRAEESAAEEEAELQGTGDNFGGHKDSMPRGPMSVGMDFSFPFAKHVYGLPEHTSPLSLPTTATGGAGLAPRYSEPYRLYNLDVFEYELDNSMALYGNIPLLMAHGLVGGKGRSTAVFWFNPSETFVDVSDGGSNTDSHKESHWISESGEIDFFILPGPLPANVFDQFTRVTGRQQLPPIFALGYHQCRWNYRDEKDVAAVEGMFEKLDYPMDVIWLDIEHTDGKRYFTWDKSVFPNPVEMQQNVSRHGRRMVTIVDPHIKRDGAYAVHSEATAKGLYVKSKDGSDFDGWCWPGSSSYLDFTSPSVRDWWAQRFSLDQYAGSTMDLFTWNDMNEPSVFNGPEVSMPKDALNLEGVEHREWHNLYGIYMQKATGEGLVARSPDSSRDPTLKQRPFVLTRAFWAGSQRFGAMWTGDNRAEWAHLKVAAPMLLSINLGGLSFAGADVGGFFGDASAELFARWYQAGSFTPFFRGHAHHDSKRREPWVFGEPYTALLRQAAMVRYSLLPLWYSLFHEARATGMPVMRTMFTEFADDASTFAMDDQWMVGGELLVKPVTEAGSVSAEVYLPRSCRWFDLGSLVEQQPSQGQGQRVLVDAPLEKIPVFLRGGRVIARKMRLRRSSRLMFFDPYTLVVAPDSSGGAAGGLYLDDEISLAYDTVGAFAVRRLVYKDGVLTCSAAAPGYTYDPVNTVERVELAGQAAAPTSVLLRSAAGERELLFSHDSAARVTTIKKPDVRVAEDWSIVLNFKTVSVE